MAKLLFTTLIIFTLGLQAQTWLKVARKKVDTAITLSDGREVKAGSTLDLHKCTTTADGNYKHIYIMMGTPVDPLRLLLEIIPVRKYEWNNMGD